MRTYSLLLLRSFRLLSSGVLVLLFAFQVTGRADTLFVSNIGDNTIEKFSSAGAGTRFATFQHAENGLAFDNAGNLFVGNWANNTIDRFNSAGVPAVFANMNLPDDLIFDSAGNLYAASFYNNTIMKFNASGVGA